MNKPQTLLSLLFSTLIMPSPGIAATPDAVGYLSEARVTLFEWGLDRLGRDLSAANFKGVNAVSTNFRDNKVLIIPHAIKADDTLSAEALCKSIIKDVKYFLFVGGPGCPREQCHGGRTILGSWFSSEFLNRSSLPPDFGASLEQSTIIRVLVSAVKREERVKCNSPLLKDTIEIAK